MTTLTPEQEDFVLEAELEQMRERRELKNKIHQDIAQARAIRYPTAEAVVEGLK